MIILMSCQGVGWWAGFSAVPAFFLVVIFVFGGNLRSHLEMKRLDFEKRRSVVRMGVGIRNLSIAIRDRKILTDYNS